MMGWAVNSIAKAVEGSIPFLPTNIVYIKHGLYSSMAERNTVNILIYVQFMLKAIFIVKNIN